MVLNLRPKIWVLAGSASGDARSKTAFTTGIGLWQFKVTPFGLCNVPATFERLMEQVLARLPTTVALLYLDDILVSGRTFEQQIDNLQMVFQRLKEANLKLNPKKCNLFQREVLGPCRKRQRSAARPREGGSNSSMAKAHVYYRC